MAKAIDPGLPDKLEGKVDPAEDGPAIEARVGDVLYRVEVWRLNALQARDLRDQTGYSIGRLMAYALTSNTLDVDVTAAVVWLARVQAGDPVPFTVVAESITVGDLLDSIPDEPEGEIVEEAGDPKG